MKLKTAMIAGGGLIGVLLVGWAGLTAFVIWANLYQAEKQGRLFYLPTFALTTDRTPVEFTMRGYVFRIPKAYLEFTHQWEGDKHRKSSFKPFFFPNWSRHPSTIWRTSRRPVGSMRWASVSRMQRI